MAYPNACQSPSGAAVQATSESSEPAKLAVRSPSAVSLERVRAGRGSLPAWSPLKTQSEQLCQVSPKHATTGSAQNLLIAQSRSQPANSRKVDVSGPGPMPTKDGAKEAGHLHQEHEPAAAQPGKGEESLIQAVPEMPRRKASMSWPDAKTGLNLVPPSRQTKGVPLSSQQDDCPDTRESNGDDGTEPDLEALLGQLVNRAEHI